MLRQRPLSKAGSEWGLSEPNPIYPLVQLPTWGDFLYLSHHTTQEDPEERKKKKNLQERLCNGSQPACHIALPMSTRSQKARAGSRVLQPSVTTQRGDWQPAPASSPSPPHSVPGTGLSRGSTSPWPIPQHKASHTF